MTRRRYRYDPESGEMVEVTNAAPQQLATKGALNHMGGLWSDRHYHGMRASDGADISSRRKHREYMKQKGLTTADDFKDTWARAARERDHYMQHGGSVRKEDIRRAIDQVMQRRR
jgi:hypothetical protein